MTALDERPVMAPPPVPGRWSGRRAVLRLARRDAQRHRARSCLVVAMVALPVVGLAAVDVVARTAGNGGSSASGRTLPAGIDAEVEPVQGAARVEQTPDGGSYSSDGPASVRPAPTQAEVRRLTGASEVLQVRSSFRRLVRPDGRSAGIEVVETDLRGPLAPAAVGTVTEGRAPQRSGEVALTAAAAQAAGTRVGGPLRLSGSAQALTVVGVLQRSGAPADGGAAAVIGLPGSLLGGGADVSDGSVRTVLELRTPDPLRWPDVLALNEQGLLVVSRAVLDDPPPDSEVPALSHQQVESGNRLDVAAFAVLAAGMGLLEVVLLAGPAFAVGARRSKRVLALLAACGGDRRQVRDVVISQGLVLGLLGAAVGVVLGTALGIAAVPVLERVYDEQLPPLTLRPLELLAIGSVGLVTAVLAALLPARSVARQDVSLALAGRREPASSRAGVPIAGLALAAAGLGVVLAGVGRRSALLILTGAALGQVGLVLCTPTMVRLLGRTGRFLPLSPRLAVRDASRNVGRTAPAVAAVMAAVAGTVASGIFVASLSERDQRSYTPQLPIGQLQVQLAEGATEADVVAAEQQVRATVPVRALTRLAVIGDSACPVGTTCATVLPERSPAKECPLGTLDRPPTQAESAAAADDIRCTGAPFARSYSSSTVVDDGSSLEVLLGAADPTAARALVAGGAVVLDPTLLDGGVLRLRRSIASREGEGNAAGELVEVPAVLARVPDGASALPASVVLSPQVAERLGVTPVVHELRAVPERPIDKAQEKVLQDALRRQDGTSYVYVERGYVDAYRFGLLALVVGAAVVTVGAVATSTALAMTDARPDLATMAAVGASRSVRRKMALTTALVLAVLGTAVGAVAGAVPGVAAIRALQRDGVPSVPDGGWPLVIPWTSLLVTAVAVPLLAGVLVALFTRSRLPVVHRRDA